MAIGGCSVALALLLNGASPAQAGVGMPEIGSLQIGSYRARLLNDSAGLRTGTNMLTVHIPDLPVGDSVTLRLHGPGGELIDVSLHPLRVLSAAEGRHAVVTASIAAPGHGFSASAGDTPGQSPQRDAASDDHARHRDQQAHRETSAGEDAHHTHARGHSGDRSDVAGGNVDGAHPGETTHAGDTPAAAPGSHGTDAHGGDVFAGFAARGAVRLPATGTWRVALTAGDGRGKPLTGELALNVTPDGPNLLYLALLALLSGGSVVYGWIHRHRAESRH